MNEKPKLYHNRIEKKFNNNREVYVSSDKDNNKIINNNEIRKKINDIINSKSFIYQTKVNIVLSNEVIQRKIVGLYNNNLVTIDNEYIPIANIKDIYK